MVKCKTCFKDVNELECCHECGFQAIIGRIDKDILYRIEQKLMELSDKILELEIKIDKIKEVKK